MVWQIDLSSASYPYLLKNIPDPPQVLYGKGVLPRGRMIAVVGTRRMTAYGQKVTVDLTTGLVKAGFVIVSGMALGVDRVAHEAALAAGGQTVAVLGAGVELIYPPEHKDLYNSIVAHGAAVSEIPGRRTVPRGRFSARNRIVSGLVEAVLITEGAIESGSLITARYALDQGRDVFAVSGSTGADYLVDQGAKSVAKVADILEELG